MPDLLVYRNRVVRNQRVAWMELPVRDDVEVDVPVGSLNVTSMTQLMTSTASESTTAAFRFM